jgi:hypothetical protein
VATHVPEPPQAASHPKCGLNTILMIDMPSQRDTQIVVFLF